MNGGGVLGGNVLIGPNDIVLATMHAQKMPAQLIGGGDEHQVINDDGIGAEDEVFLWTVNRIVEINFAAGRIERAERAPGEEECVAFAVDGRSDGGRATKTVLCRLPEHVTGVFVERNDSGVIGAADVEEDGVAFDQRRANHTVPFFSHAEFAARIDVPQL